MRTLRDWCGSEAIKLPRERLPGDFVAYLKDLFAANRVQLISLGDGIIETKVKAALPQIDELSAGLLEAVREYLRGHPSRAFFALQKALESVKSYVDVLVSNPGPAEGQMPLYRMRTSAVPARFKREDFFHIPFEKRGLVSSQRYSINGLPCLYLGMSSYVCWEELGRPPFSSIYIAQMRSRDPMRRVLDIAHIPFFIGSWWLKLWEADAPGRADWEAGAVARVVCWPLMAACSIRAMEASAAFKPEYIVPQLLLQWVTQSPEVYGIRYFSTKVGRPTALYLGANFVYPARTDGDVGHCADLRNLFDVTAPLSWEVALASGMHRVGSNVSGEIEIAPGEFVDYQTTQFIEIEGILSYRTAQTLVAPGRSLTREDR